jgi:hypothetical protein
MDGRTETETDTVCKRTKMKDICVHRHCGCGLWTIGTDWRLQHRFDNYMDDAIQTWEESSGTMARCDNDTTRRDDDTTKGFEPSASRRDDRNTIHQTMTRRQDPQANWRVRGDCREIAGERQSRDRRVRAQRR